MTLVEHARTAFGLAQPADVLVRADAVAVRFGGVGRLRKRVADRGIHARTAAIAELRLQPIVVADARFVSTLTWRTPPFTGRMGRVALAAATLCTWPGAVRSNTDGAFKSTVRSSPVQCWCT